ncbi:RRQRL motif-containing zinc-binding protein [Streptomyces sp. NPDC006992]|uniref:RRQRL motif-containing zinc-binding protein n=1 Tax=Streptomyces sp. NPDC006992 TaxID=3155601 RepID=UPI0033D7CBB0
MARRVLRYWDPHAERHDVPTYPWGLAPEGLATRDQLVARGLRPRGRHVAQIGWDSRRCPGGRYAYLYRAADARPPQPRSPAQTASLGKAQRARRICPDCGIEREYRIPTSLGCCTDCADGYGVAA